ncbi:hypothetical protein ABI59_01005 [Acidobacteria bacterium Mor1]|nr:hypothetical protein ABI59_01005 [Acidobacteria bacterium Mor1]
MRRRVLLRLLGAGSAGLIAAPYALAKPSGIRADRLDDLALRLREAKSGAVLGVAADAVSRGARAADILGATFLAGVHDIRPQPVGNHLHVLMTVESGFRMAERLPRKEGLLVALWMVATFKESQHQDDGWTLPPAPKVPAVSPVKAEADLIRGLEDWDAEKVDRAIVQLLPHRDRQSIYNLLWPWTARCMASLGHKIVYGAMTEAVLCRLDWRHAQPTLRSLLHGLMAFGRVGKPLDASFDSAREIVTTLRPHPEDKPREESPEASIPLVRIISKGTHREAQTAVAAALNDGVHPRVVWDAVQLVAAEQFQRRKSQRPLSGEAIRAAHAVTEMWSMAYAARRSTPAVRNLLTLQAAGWLADFRGMLLDRDAIGAEIDILAGAEPGVDVTPRLARWDRQAATRSVEYHQFKVICALIEETRHVHPRWHGAIVDSAEGYLPGATVATGERTRRGEAALRKAGVL